MHNYMRIVPTRNSIKEIINYVPIHIQLSKYFRDTNKKNNFAANEL